jgi:hypothetical protein
MSVLGKILAVFNILAAALFVYLAGLDYGKRQSWAYAVYRHELAITGLPLEEAVTEPIQNVRQADQLNEATLRDLSQAAGGQVPKTQEEEVKRVHNALRDEVARQDGPAAKRNKLVEVLRPFKLSSLERHDLDDKLRAPADDKLVSSLSRSLDETFEPALRPVYEADGSKAKSDPPRRWASATRTTGTSASSRWSAWKRTSARRESSGPPWTT